MTKEQCVRIIIEARNYTVNRLQGVLSNLTGTQGMLYLDQQSAIEAAGMIEKELKPKPVKEPIIYPAPYITMEELQDCISRLPAIDEVYHNFYGLPIRTLMKDDGKDLEIDALVPEPRYAFFNIVPFRNNGKKWLEWVLADNTKLIVNSPNEKMP